MKIIVHTRNKAVLHCEETPRALIMARRLEGFRKWLKAGGLHFVPTRSNFQWIEKFFPKVPVEWPVDRLPDKVVRMGGVYISLTKGYECQDMAQEFMENAPEPHVALFCDPGTGKTKMAIDRAAKLWCQGVIDGVVVVAPKGVHEQWARQEILKHCGVPTKIQIWFKDKVRLVHDAQQPETLPFLVINYDGLKSPKSREEVERYIKSFGRYMEVIDESHCIKNPSTGRWDACNRIAILENCASRLILTGTPLAKDLTDEWSQLKVLNENILGMRTKKAFQGRYCIMEKTRWGSMIFAGPKNVREFQAKTAPHIFRARKEDLPGLPKKVYRQFRFSMDKEQRSIFQRMLRELIVQIDSGEVVTAKNAAIKVAKLQQISNGFLYDRENGLQVVRPIITKKTWVNPRLKAFRDFVSSCEDETLLVWCRYHQDIHILTEAFPGNCHFYGRNKDSVNEEMLRQWLSPNGPRFMFATSSLSVGRNLQTRGCRHAIYWSNTENSIDRQQSEDRIHRIGSTSRFVTFTDMVARGSRDLAILANLKAKKDLADFVLDDIRNELAELEDFAA